METQGIIEGGGLVVSGVFVKMVFDFLRDRHNARNQRTEIANNPLSVRQVRDCVRTDECREKMDRLDKHLTGMELLWRDDVNYLHKKVNICAEGIAEIRGMMKGAPRP
jgi:hypothetical protein